MTLRPLASSFLLALVATLTLPATAVADEWTDEAEEAFIIMDGQADPLAADELDFDDPELMEEFDGLERSVASKRSGDLDDFDFEDEEDFAFEDDAEAGSEPVEDFDFDPLEDDEDDGLGALEDAEDEALRDLEVGAPPPAVAATSISLSVVGKTPLADNYLPKVVATDRDSIVIELPVLLGRSRADFNGEPYWLVASVHVDGVKVAESRQYVVANSLAEFGPSFAFVKLLAPVASSSGAAEIHISKSHDATSTGQALFRKAVRYAL